jgi:hypothetical protein
LSQQDIGISLQDMVLRNRNSHARRSSLMSWGTFWAAQAMPGRDILVAATLVVKVRQDLVLDVSKSGSARCD